MSQELSRPVDLRRPDIRVTKRDIGTIERLLAGRPDDLAWRSVNFLARELARATIVDGGAVPRDVVTLGSRIEYREEGQDKSRAGVLSLPGERTASHEALSILSPIGTALLGLSAGQSICFAGPDGRPVTVTVIKVGPAAEPRRPRARARRTERPRHSRASQDG